MDPEITRSPSARKWLMLLGGVLAFLVIFGWLESLVRPDPARSGEAAATANDSDSAASPDPPRVRRLQGGGIEIRRGLLHKSTIRLEDDEKEEALFDCLSQRIEQIFANGTEGWDRGRVERETLQIRFDCLRTVREAP